MHAESDIDLSPHTKHNYTYYKISIINADQIPGMLFVIEWGSDCNCPLHAFLTYKGRGRALCVNCHQACK